MKHLLAFVFTSMFLLVGCTTNNSGSASNDEIAISQVEQAVPPQNSAIDNNNEDFFDFIKKFHSDSIFQSQRINNEIHGYCDTIHIPLPDSIENRIWDKAELASYLRLFDHVFNDNNSKYELSIYRGNRNKFYEYITSSDILYELVFKKADSQWQLTDLTISSNYVD